MDQEQKRELEREALIDAAGRAGFEELKLSMPELAAAIESFPFDAARDSYCGHCAEELYYHLVEAGFHGFHQHAHGHSFVANGRFVVDVWPDNTPKVWDKRDPILADSVYATRLDNACWCGDPEYGPEEHIGVPKSPAPKAPGL